ncbi:hypothetical protein Golob_011772 [Gossypium lobatum]|uniref:Reverse transcriptase zinc-binding domain-containing protein n=1 Tax=Gossypium lobatum TaxID=34289 RepID=A0A7J8MQK7_9ROSI|nr:hypothetical protein [Gossypium lobatum]
MKVVLEIFGLGMKDAGTLIKFTSCMGKIWVNRNCSLPIENESQSDRIRLGHELLPRNVKIASIRNGFDQGCPRCGAVAEALIHALKDCPISREGKEDKA